ncbi:hypothetical protein AVEN_275552-1, partial [Araneus ventricosus]
MLSKVYCSKCKTLTETQDLDTYLSANDHYMVKGSCVKCKTKKSGFVTKQEYEILRANSKISVPRQQLDEHSGTTQLVSLYSYYDLTGDGNVPIPFVLLSVEGILDKRIKGQPLKRLYDAVRILRAINAPFTQDDPVEPPKDVMDNFMDDYMNALSLAKKCDKDLKEKEQLILKQLLTHLHQALDANG